MTFIPEGVTSPLNQALEGVNYIVRQTAGEVDVSPEELSTVAERIETTYSLVLEFPKDSEEAVVERALRWLGDEESLRPSVTRKVRTARQLLDQGRLVEDEVLIDREIVSNFEIPKSKENKWQ